MPHSVNPAQGFLDNWNTKPSRQAFYQQNGGDEYWGTIFRSQRSASCCRRAPRSASGTWRISSTASAPLTTATTPGRRRRYFIPFVVRAYRPPGARAQTRSPARPPIPTWPARCECSQHWNGTTTLGSPAMSIFMNFLEAYERNVFEGGTLPRRAVHRRGQLQRRRPRPGHLRRPRRDGHLQLPVPHPGPHPRACVPCGTLCYQGGYFARPPRPAPGGEPQRRDHDPVRHRHPARPERPRLRHDRHRRNGASRRRRTRTGTASTRWRSRASPRIAGRAASQNRSTFMMAVDVGPRPSPAQDVLPPGQSGFISAAGAPSPHLCDQVGLFNDVQV